MILSTIMVQLDIDDPAEKRLTAALELARRFDAELIAFGAADYRVHLPYEGGRAIADAQRERMEEISERLKLLRGPVSPAGGTRRESRKASRWRTHPRLRPESIVKQGEQRGGRQTFAFERRIDVVEPTGPNTLMIFTLGGIEAIARVHPEDKAAVDTMYQFEVDLKRAKLFDPETGKRLSADD